MSVLPTSDSHPAILYTFPMQMGMVKLLLLVAALAPLAAVCEANSCLFPVDSEGHVRVPSNVSHIRSASFSGCNLTSIVIPDGVMTIGDYSFAGSLLRSIAFDEGASLIGIGFFAFVGNAALISIDLPDSLLSIGEHAFDSFSNLRSVLFGRSLSFLSTSAFQGCSSLETADFTNCKDLREMGSFALSECASLRSLVLPPRLKAVPPYLCRMCTSLGSVEIPSSVATVGSGAFYRSGRLSSVSFSPTGSLTVIEAFAFAACGTLSLWWYQTR